MSEPEPAPPFSSLPDPDRRPGSERYFFDVDDGEKTHVDETGMILTAADQIAPEAYNVLKHIVYDRWPEGRKTMTVRVRDRSGRLVYTGTMTIDGRRLAQ